MVKLATKIYQFQLMIITEQFYAFLQKSNYSLSLQQRHHLFSIKINVYIRNRCQRKNWLIKSNKNPAHDYNRAILCIFTEKQLQSQFTTGALIYFYSTKLSINVFLYIKLILYIFIKYLFLQNQFF
jgi:hypothetical protein